MIIVAVVVVKRLYSCKRTIKDLYLPFFVSWRYIPFVTISIWFCLIHKMYRDDSNILIKFIWCRRSRMMDGTMDSLPDCKE